MTNNVVAIQGDNLNKINIKSDTTLYLANEAQNKGYKIFYYEPKELSIIDNKVIAKGSLIKLNNSNNNFYKTIKKIKFNLSKAKFILIRQDPPFNLEYISTTYILDTIKKNVKIINNPSAIRNVSEKLYSAQFSKYMPSTIFTKNIKEAEIFFNKNTQIIMKPIHGYGGNEIHLIEKFNKKFVEKFIRKHDHVMFQKFLPNIKYGDTRVFLINGKICGAISRVPKRGSFLSNMSKGAKPKLTILTKKEIRISKIIAEKLKVDNIYFAGIDFINGKLNGDINVTSPTGLKTYFDLSKINLAKFFWKGLKV